jgi:signal transduction histidine kinase
LLIFNFIRIHLARSRAERALAKGERLKTSVLESIGKRVVVLDAEGNIIAANHYWDEYLRAHGRKPRNGSRKTPYFGLASVLQEFGERTAVTLEGIRSVCEGKRPRFELEYPVGSGEDQNWILLVVTPLEHADGGAVMIYLNVTQSKKDETAIRSLSGKLISAQEDERSRIARELHDDINQQLALIAIQAQCLSVSQAAGMVFRQQAKDLWEKVTLISSDVQALSHRLYSTKLDYLGLQAALGGLCREFTEQQRIAATLHVEGEGRRLDHETSLALFRVAQESLRNVSKHSHATSVHVFFVNEPARLILRVEDDGVGFDHAGDGNGIGVLSMRERMQLVHGTLDILSKAGEGTSVQAVVPIHAPHSADAIRMPAAA